MWAVSKCWYRRVLIMLLLFIMTMGTGMLIQEDQKREASVESLSGDLLIPGGMPVGIYMETDGVMVLGTERLKSVNGESYEPAERLVRAGDYIVGIGEKEIINKKQLMEEVSKIHSEDIVLKLRRGSENVSVKIKPVKCKGKNYKLGIWVRDNTQGLGTITFLTKNSEYGALGHGIHDIDTGKLLKLSKGTLYKTTIRDIKKGIEGEPGGMEGIIVYNRYNVLGTIEKNTETGIYGRVDKIEEIFEDQTPVKIATKEEIEKGDAKIRCAIDGEVKEYDIRITKIDFREKAVNKGIVLEVTDERLLEETGGIVQGMSGSPIIQNNKIIGAVTHVFVQDAAKGYGIFIQNMLKNVE